MPPIPEPIVSAVVGASEELSREGLEAAVKGGIKGILGYLDSHGGVLPSKAKDWLRQETKNEWARKRDYFIEDPELFKNLEYASTREAFQDLKDIISPHQYIDIIRTGFVAKDLNDSGEKQRVDDIVNRTRREYGRKGTRVLTIVTHGLLDFFVEWLKREKEENELTNLQAGKVLEDIIEEWDQHAIFHSASAGTKVLEGSIVTKINDGEKLFFILGYAAVCDAISIVMRDLRKDRFFEIKGYGYKHERTMDGYGRFRRYAVYLDHI
ncbi:MAG: hypothetical protein MAG715_00399 [Methanonatronarchaeales archaeon]|nr:hypothetical protein [Methanonatronarchaeales archaeon]